MEIYHYLIPTSFGLNSILKVPYVLGVTEIEF